MRTALAEHFENLNPRPVGGTPREFVRAGKKIFEEGVPDSNIPFESERWQLDYIQLRPFRERKSE
jgi:hypothetical protein